MLCIRSQQGIGTNSFKDLGAEAQVYIGHLIETFIIPHYYLYLST